MFIRMLETEGSDSYGKTRHILIAVVVVLVVVLVVVVVYIIRLILSSGRGSSTVIQKDSKNGLLATVNQNGSDHIEGDSGTGRDGGDPNAQ
ncbi:hypothetical protein AB205_0054860 [Aquarana catesbeiana]|uniref:Uncharacterized protein n=1 Tax=Aquarana catesbeiana TaxID=8400 RepID=A0A2G9QA81_AQUCT|nr:hypothetical protein AB205_0054860 [Aquarana catesbeiana]